MSRPPDPAPTPARALVAFGLAGLAVITLAEPGATRMYAWPWELARWICLAGPLAALVTRGIAPGPPAWRVAGGLWRWAVGFAAAGIMASAWLSPWRGPSLLGALTPLAAFAVFFLLSGALAEGAAVREHVERSAAWVAAVVAGASLAYWAAAGLEMRGRPAFLHDLFFFRNPYPLGHSNYTAGLALLLLPWPWLQALRARTLAARAMWLAVSAGVLATLFTSGSRGGLLGLAALAIIGAVFAGRGRRRTAVLLLASLAVVAGLGLANPRVRSLLRPADASLAPDPSHAQRAAMARAGWRMGRDRPLFGWGPNSVPLAYPRYRAGLDGGVEDALQLHSTPLQLWAETGAAGLAAACALLLLAALGAGRHPAAAAALGGYAVFALTDWQLDVPAFAFAVAALLALLAEPTRRPASRGERSVLAIAAAAAMGLIAVAGRPDPAPVLNARALTLARDPAHAGEAAILFERSLALNPDQEIAHFNLGWLQVVSDPASAERHFAQAARLVPDKGGVYFGLALARFNRGRPDRAAAALALECLDDPTFLVSPWWNVPELGRLRPEVLRLLRTRQREALARLDPARWPASEARYAGAFFAWCAGEAPAAAVLVAAATPGRRAYFARHPAPPDPTRRQTGAPVRVYRRERTGYDVLMRNLDLPAPLDLYQIQEDPQYDAQAFLFPPKGWLPSPVLRALVQADLAEDARTR